MGRIINQLGRLGVKQEHLEEVLDVMHERGELRRGFVDEMPIEVYDDLRSYLLDEHVLVSGGRGVDWKAYENFMIEYCCELGIKFDRRR